MATISTHVLDTASGFPAKGVAIELRRKSNDVFNVIGKGITNRDGRVLDLLNKENEILKIGEYQMYFFLEDYMQANQHTSYFYPFVEITFRIEDASSHYHVPLLISPYGFSTYRGS